jgi:hypothetical protein
MASWSISTPKVGNHTLAHHTTKNSQDVQKIAIQVISEKEPNLLDDSMAI